MFDAERDPRSDKNHDLCKVSIYIRLTVRLGEGSRKPQFNALKKGSTDASRAGIQEFS